MPHERMKCALILNPRAAVFGSSRMVELVRRFSKLGPVIVTSHRDDLAAQLRTLADQGIEWLALCGGDGTFHVAVAEAMHIWGERLPRLVLLHGGTMGIVCRELGLSDPFAMLDAMEAATAQGVELATTTLPTIDVGGRVCFNFGAGMLVGFARRATETRGLGPGAVWSFAAHLAVSTLIDGPFSRDVLEPWRGGVAFDDEPPVVREVSALYASPLDQLWFFRGYSKCRTGPGQFRVMTLTGEPMEMLKQAPAFALGTHAPGASVRPARTMTITAREPFPFVADGELYQGEAGSMTITSGPGLSVAIPRLAGRERRWSVVRRALAK